MSKRRRKKLSPFPATPPTVSRAVAGVMALGVVVAACGSDETTAPQAGPGGYDVGPQPGPGPGGSGGVIAPQPGPGPGGGGANAGGDSAGGANTGGANTGGDSAGGAGGS